MTTPNFDLLDRVLSQIDGNEQWKQGTYRCDSGMCFAGWTVELAGGQWVTDDINSTRYHHVHAGDISLHVHDWAARQLGLTEDEADQLFDGFNKLDTIAYFIETLRLRHAAPADLTGELADA